MLEGPAIRSIADELRGVLAGQTIEAAHIDPQAWEGRPGTLVGDSVCDVEARGHVLLAHFASGWSLYHRSQRFSQWVICPRGQLPKTDRKLRVALHVARHSALVYSATELSLFETARLPEHPYLSRLGLDVLSPGVEPADVLLLLERHPRRSIGALLLDQEVFAGIGNALRSELLFVAGLPPRCRVKDLNQDRRARLARAILLVSQRAYKRGGVTLEPTLAAALGAQRPRPRGEPKHYVFGRARQPCYDCAAPILKEEASGRRLYRCPRCQRMP